MPAYTFLNDTAAGCVTEYLSFLVEVSTTWPHPITHQGLFWQLEDT